MEWDEVLRDKRETLFGSLYNFLGKDVEIILTSGHVIGGKLEYKYNDFIILTELCGGQEGYDALIRADMIAAVKLFVRKYENGKWSTRDEWKDTFDRKLER